VGRKAGITKNEYISLIKLDKKDFPGREWTALIYAREWAYGKGREVPDEYSREFSKNFSPDEQALIKKLLCAMLFANYCGNSCFKRPWRGETKTEACELNFDIPEEYFNDKS